MLRLDSTGDYTEENSIVVTKVQFFAIEIARNREGDNDDVRTLHKPKPRRHRPKPADAANAASPAMAQVEKELHEILAGNHSLLK